MTGGVTSNGALAKLSTTTQVLEKDPLLRLICNTASPLQLTIKTKKKGTELSLEINDGADTITHRNAILRSLCGMALHNALDRAPYYLLGGHSAASVSPACPSAALAIAGVSSWMSVADSIRSKSSEEMLMHLDTFLSSRSFLVPAPRPTLADLDVYFALVGYVGDAGKEKVEKKTNLMRWMSAVASSYPEIPSIVSSTATPLPVFFYGDEEDSVLDSVFVSSSGNGSSSSSKPKTTTASNKNASSTAAPTTPNANDKSNPEGISDEQKKAAAEKRAKKAAEKAAKKKANKAKSSDENNNNNKQSTAATTELNISALDIRVGHILKAWPHEEAEKLYCEEVDVGEDKPRSIASGLRPFYPLDEMQNRKVLVLCNLKARNLVGFPSHGMVLCASNADHTAVEFVVPPPDAKVGERVVFEGYESGEPEAENKVAKKKMFEKLAPDLKTDGEGKVVWKGACSVTTAGPCVASKGMKDAQVS